MNGSTSVFDLNGNRCEVPSERESLKREMFEKLLHSIDGQEWRSLAQRLLPRRGHLALVPPSPEPPPSK